MKKIIHFWYLTLTVFIFTNCNKDSPQPTSDDSALFPVDTAKTLWFDKMENQYSSLNQAIYYTYKDWYLWYDQVDFTKVDYNSYSDPQALMNAMKYSKDKWSFIEDTTANNALFQDGQYLGQGLDFWYDLKEYNVNHNLVLRLSYVYPDSPAGQAGLYRGMRLTKVNGIDILNVIQDETSYNAQFSKSTIAYELVDSLGNTNTYSITDGTVKVQTVLYKTIIEVSGRKVGYIVFNSFLGTAKEELTNAFSYFKSQDVADLILDLRYNGGGYISVAQFLSGMIAGSNAGPQKTFITEQYNARHSIFNFDYNFTTNANDLNLNRVFIIGSRFTASASELVINGLKPYIQVNLIGETTTGKPVGFFGFTYKDKIFYPVSLQSINANGTGGYYNGIDPNVFKVDGIKYNWGDVREYCLKEALYYIENGSFSGTDKNVRMEGADNMVFYKPERKGLKQLHGL